MSKTSTGTRKKAALGRGLGSLLGEKTEPAETPISIELEEDDNSSLSSGFVEAPTRLNDESRVWKMAIENLVPNQNQPRKEFNPDALKELSASIKAQGILQPIVARRISNNKFEIIAGERRWRASGLAGLKEVPVILKNTDDQKSLELALIENIQRENLNPVEEAEAYEFLIEGHNMTQQQVADKVGKERATVANLLRLLNLVPEMRKALAQGDLSLSLAKTLLSLTDDAKQREVGFKIIKEKLTVKAAEKLISEIKSSKLSTNNNDKIDELDVSRQLMRGLSEEMQKIIGTKVSIEYAKGKGKLSVHFYSDDELNNFVDKVRTSWQK